MNLPSKEEIKEKYGISSDDFEILTTGELPTPLELQLEGAHLEKGGWWHSTEVWFMRIIGGAIKKVILIGSLVAGATFLKIDAPLYDARDIVYSQVSYASENLATQADKYLLSKEPMQPEDWQQKEELGQTEAILPTGTIVAPVSGSYII